MRHVGQFSAMGGDGRRYTVYEYRDVIDVSSLAGGRATRDGLPSFKLDGGGHVNKLSDTEFRIVATGVKLTRE